MGRSDDRVVAIIQARMGSTRLPGKSLRLMQGRPMIQLMLERLGSNEDGVEYAVATSDDRSDDPIFDLCESLGICCIRGSLQDVLDRYVKALSVLDPDVALRLTGDNPVLDSQAIRVGLRAYAESEDSDAHVGVCNHLRDRTDPLGYCVEVFEPAALHWLAGEATKEAEREHVTLGFKERELYRSFHILEGSNPGMRWTIDTSEDFTYIDRMFAEMGTDVSGPDAVRWCREHPHPGNLDSRGYYL